MIQRHYKEHLIPSGSNIKEALKQLDKLAADAILFVVSEELRLIGSLTDGDVRRGLLRGLELTNVVDDFIQPNPRYVRRHHDDIHAIINFRNGNFKIIPVLDDDNRIVNIINFRFLKSYLPVDAIIMAGGRGERLKPLTDQTPKPLLQVGDKPIIEHNIDRLSSFGIHNFHISVRYLGEQIEQYFGNGEQKNIHIEYVWEDAPLGTIGAARKITGLEHPYVLLTNSDILSTIDYEDFFLSFLEADADLSVVTIPYDVNIPYAVLETTNGHVMSFKEKPTYTYYSNGGIYLLKKEHLNLIPEGRAFNATDLMETLIKSGKTVHSYPLRGYWLDIGKHEDFNKAQQDIHSIKL